MNNWSKANISLENYKEFIEKKGNKFELSLIDLLYVSNFKGGNASVHIKNSELNSKLSFYSKKLKEIDAIFTKKALKDLDQKELEILQLKLSDIIELTKNKETEISGFKASYLSALLHAHFPKLIPILDRKILINLEVIKDKDKLIPSTKQVRDIQKYFNNLVLKMHKISTEEDKDIREIDKEYFNKKLPEWAKSSKK